MLGHGGRVLKVEGMITASDQTELRLTQLSRRNVEHAHNTATHCDCMIDIWSFSGVQLDCVVREQRPIRCSE